MPAPGHQDVADPTKRLVVLTGGLLLPAFALLADGLAGETAWPVVVTGSMVLSLLVLARMAGLLHVVRAQSVQLSALARSDSLTGTPNRRTWDLELSRACQARARRPSPVWPCSTWTTSRPTTTPAATRRVTCCSGRSDRGLEPAL